MRRALLGVAMASALVALVAPTAGAQQGVAITPTGGAEFPQRAYLVTLPDGSVASPGQITVLENGESPRKVAVTSGGAGVGVMLVIDASGSMRGGPIDQAVKAARAFADRRAPEQQLGIVTFNSQSTLALPLTTDDTAIDAALAAPPALAPQTHIYDGVSTALDELEKGDVTSGVILVLSDGSDSGSSLPAATVAARARKEKVRIFSVGLRSGAFEPSELQALADAGRGRYAEASSPRALRGIFAQLGSQLAGEYLVRYESRAAPDTDARVAVRVEGVPGLATDLYTVPGAAEQIAKDTFWTSRAAALTITLFSALLLAGALALLLLRRMRPGSVRERVSAFVTGDESADRDSGAAILASRVLDGTERSLEKLNWWSGFKQDVELARISLPPVRIIICTLAATFIAACVLGLVGGALLSLLSLLVPLVVRFVIKQRVARQRRAFAEQLPDTLQGVASALRAGHGLVGALAMVVEDAPEPSRTELRRVVSDEQLGMTLEEAFTGAERRMKSRDIQQIALVAELQRETGGNMAEVLDRVTDAVRGRIELRRIIRSLTAQGRISRWVLTCLPIGMLGLILVLNADYVMPLFETTRGQILLVVGAVMLVAGSLVIKKIVDFEV